MRQASYLIIGSGRLAKHFSFYFKQLGIQFQQWSRRDQSLDLHDLLLAASHILLLINDAPIEPFIQQHPALHDKIVLHCSGALQTPLAYGAHPLMTFTQDLYDEATYRQIPFILDTQRDASELLPGLPNPTYYIPRREKAYYHALCVMANNFSTLLWQKFFYELQHRYAIPVAAGQLMLQQTANNIRRDPFTALTGPLVRNDQQTLLHDLQALNGDAFESVFTAMIHAYQQQQEQQHECP